MRYAMLTYISPPGFIPFPHTSLPSAFFGRMKTFSSYISFPVVVLFGLFYGHGSTAPQPAVTLGDSLLLSLSQPSTANGNNSFENSTTFEAVDPDFQLVPQFKGRKLFPITCLRVAVEAALQLALEDFEGIVPQKQVFKLPDHPQVEIVLLPQDEHGGSTMPWKYAVWALNFAINMMIRNDRYQSSVFFILQKNHGLGALSFSLSQPRSLEPPFISTQSLTNKTNGTISQLNGNPLRQELGIIPSSNFSKNVVSSPDLAVFFKLTGSRLKINDIFITALDLLREFAVFPRTARLVADVTHVRTSDLYLKYRDPNNPPRTMADPPFFENEWLLRALALMPAFMVSQGTYKEVKIQITVDEIIIGEVSLTKSRPRSDTTTA